MTCCVDCAVLVRRAACAICPRTKIPAIIIACRAVLSLVEDERLASGVLDRVEEWGVFVGMREHNADAGEQHAQRALVHCEFFEGPQEPQLLSIR